MLDRDTVDSLFPADLRSPEEWERLYPQRTLAPEAKVTRFGPSPTGSLHIGGVYAAMIAKAVAHASGGAYFVRIEDTDQAREVSGSHEQFARAFAYFGIGPDEDETAPWGPYRQSARERVYLSYARELLRQGLAYPCFATRDELAEMTAAQQRAKVPTGYYGRWATWRDADPDEVRRRLAAGEPYVVRFRSPVERPRRVSYVDAIRGRIEQEDNRNDVVILKSSDSSPRLPTYHFAHVVDDHLMRVNLVTRGEEWISSVPVHHQLFDALGLPRVEYAHIAPLMKQEGSSRRKLSKRKDPEASVDFYIGSGYPADAVLYYLRGLANGRLAELPVAQALAEPVRLAECNVAGALVDMAKLDDISSNLIAEMSSPEILERVTRWAHEHDPELARVVSAQPDLAVRALDVERVGVDSPRKDLAKWADFRGVYGLFFPDLFTPVTDPADERFGGLDPVLVRKLAAEFAGGYTEHDDQPTWFAQIRDLAGRHGFAANAKEYKKNPDAYPGSLREAANTIRVLLTGATRSPDLHAVARALGADEVLRRLRAVAA